jgi:hypothetical protein
MTEEKQVLRTRFDGTYEIFNSRWGNYLVKCADPLAEHFIEERHLNHFEPNENAHRIPSNIWSAWIRLCFHFVDKIPNEMEVEVRFLASENNPSEYIAVVPKQNVTKSAVRAPNFDECCNLLTGEKYTSYPPVGYFPCGSSHSHNTFAAFFSSTDNDSELRDPGIHLTVGSINVKKQTYEIAASVVGNLRRFVVNYNYLIDTTPDQTSTFHPNVLEYIDYTTPVYTYAKHLGKFWKNSKHQQKRLPPSKNFSRDNASNNYREWRNDPHHKNYNEERKIVDDYAYDRYQEWWANQPESDFERAIEVLSKGDPFFYDEDGTILHGFTETDSGETLKTFKETAERLIDSRLNDSDSLEELKEILSELLIGIELTLSS